MCKLTSRITYLGDQVQSKASSARRRVIIDHPGFCVLNPSRPYVINQAINGHCRPGHIFALPGESLTCGPTLWSLFLPAKLFQRCVPLYFRGTVAMSVSESEVMRIHPRRRPFKAAPSSVAPGQSPNPQNPSPSGSPAIRLRKGETFNTPTSPPSEDRDPLLDFRSLPRRSPTCTKSLEDIAAGEERIIDILGNLSIDSTDSPNSDNSRVGEDLPVPTAIVQAHIRASANTEAPEAFTNSPPSLLPSSPMNSPKKAWNDTFHASDSGLGSSVSSADSEPPSCQKQGKLLPPSDIALLTTSSVKTRKMSWAQGTQSAITSSIQTIEPENAPKRKLGPVACKQIERFVLVPLLKEERLKTFHPLVRSIPHRIAGREIGCLRDLEKAFLGLTRVSGLCIACA